MILSENFIKENALGSLYGEWAKKAECWESLKLYGKIFKDIKIPEDDLQKETDLKRIRISDSEVNNSLIVKKQVLKMLVLKSGKKYISIARKGCTEYFTNAAHNIGRKLKEGIRPTSNEIILANELLNKIIFKTPIFDFESELLN